jgi:DNA mismatch repair protein MutL
MPDIINLLPDTLANQIAAGEVIQRPASAVKEMLENAVDAGATDIHLILKDAGKQLIQVIDNGKGMSDTDARMCFERHATSKINTIDDLFNVRTMGFRGEALASIAAVARVELKSRQEKDEAGTSIIIENGQVQSQEVCQTPSGTSLSVKNLFYNVPARRNFLKTNSTEMRHIVDEFTRVAMANPSVGFKMTHNDGQLFHLESSGSKPSRKKLKQRILALLGNSLHDKLVAVSEETDFIQINGFCGTPDAATKTRGQQFFFVNNRFIKSAYLNHAIKGAYSQILSKDAFPMFVLFIDTDPQRIDINVHPTKQEIKFEEDKIIYAFVNSAVKHALSKFSITPSIDFNVDASIENLAALNQPFTAEKQTTTKDDFLYQSFTQKGQAHFLPKTNERQDWKERFAIQDQLSALEQPETEDSTPFTEKMPNYFQVNNVYVGFSQSQKVYLIHQQNAHERVLYERFSQAQENNITIQKCLVPQTWELSAADAIVINELLEELLSLGFELEAFGGNTFIIQGVPADVPNGQEMNVLEELIDHYKYATAKGKHSKRERLMRTLARQKSIRAGKKLSAVEMHELVQQLFACQFPTENFDGEKTMIVLSSSEIDDLFHKK